MKFLWNISNFSNKIREKDTVLINSEDDEGMVEEWNEEYEEFEDFDDDVF